MASLMPMLDLDDFSRLDFPVPAFFTTDPSPRCGGSSTSAMRPPTGASAPFSHLQQQHHHHPQQQQPLDIAAQNPFAPPLENPPTSMGTDFATFAPRFDFTAPPVSSAGLTVGYGNLTQHYIAQHYDPALLPRPVPAAPADAPAFDTPFADPHSFSLPLAPTAAEPAAAPFLPPVVAAASVPSGATALSSSSTGGAASSGAAPSAPAAPPPPRKRRTPPAGAVSKDKLEERRRKNRESSSRCYYNRKRQIEQVERTLTAHKRRAIALYAQELELRNENARLKKELVMRNIRIPATMLTTTRSEPFSRPPVSHFQR